MNEEEVKVKYVLPWLEQTGVDLQDLQLERSFTVRVGRQNISVSSESVTASGRLDILVRRGEKNLCIVETKASDLALTNDDRDQAISYARLVHPLAPYAVVTNGNQYKLYNSVTKALVDPSDIEIDGFEAALPDADLAEAQRLFLALSPHNLAAFCRRQVDDELRSVKGTIADGKKYVPELHVPRAGVLKSLDAFYSDPAPGLILVGESGLGKTCELCSIVDSLIASGRPVLFFNGVSLEGDILGAIAGEFAWTFNGSLAPVEVMKRIERFAGNTPLTIAVDAIDEWRLDSKVNHLSSLLKAVQHRKIKIVISCKSSALEQFLVQRGNPTFTSSVVMRVDLPSFSTQEFFQALEKYQRAYQFSGAFEDVVLDQAKDNPFLLRVLFDVARSSSAKHLTFSSSEFFDAYYDRAVRKTSDRQRAAQTLEGVAKVLYARDTDWVFESDLRQELGLSVNETLMDELFEFGFLIRGRDSDSELAISFYFQQFRDYIICFRAMHFQKLNRSELMREFAATTISGVKAAAFAHYYRLASSDHRLVFDAEVRANAQRYLHCYTKFVHDTFPTLEAEFDPPGKGRIGFLGELLFPALMVEVYGFRRLEAGDEEVHFVPRQQRTGRSNLAYLAGGRRLHGTESTRGFRENFDVVAEVRENEVLSQLHQIIKNGRLNESDCPEMLCEYIIRMVLQHDHIFSSLLSPDRRRINYPLQLELIPKCILKEKLTREIWDELVESKQPQRDFSESGGLAIVSWSTDLTPDERQMVRVRVDQALTKGQLPSNQRLYADLEDLEARLTNAVAALNNVCTSISTPPPFVEAHDAVRSWKEIEPCELEVHLKGLYAAFLSNYRSLVEKNFSTLKLHFKLYSEQPVAVHLVIGSGFNLNRGYGFVPLGVYFARSRSGLDSVEVAKHVTVSSSASEFRFTVDDVEFEGMSWLSTTVGHVFSSEPGLSDRQFREMSLRTLVYATIQEELSAVEAVLRQ